MKNTFEIISCFNILSHPHLKKMLTTLILALVISPAAMSTGIYKWTDENGKVHYGSQRPPDAEAEKLKLQVSQPTPSPEKAKEDKETDEANLPEDDKAKKERLAYCKTERKRLKTVAKNKTIHEKDATGKVIQLAAKERKQRLSKIQANIDKYCK